MNPTRPRTPTPTTRAVSRARGHRGARIASYPTIGVDEAGRGALAGPVVAAAVALPEDFPTDGIADSKSLAPLQRAELYSIITKEAYAVGIGTASASVVDAINVLNAALLAMARAVLGTEILPGFLLVDGNREVPIAFPQRAVVGGDRSVTVIAAASIVAKVYRDELMNRLARRYPEYGFDEHKGYSTAFHREALYRYGPTPVHRFTFKPVARLTGGLFT